jgi:biphenyl-2,3-diol 1,2-dioxygenase
MSRIDALGYLVFGVSDQVAWNQFLTDYLGTMEGATGGIGDERVYRIDDYAARIITIPAAEDDIAVLGFEVRDAAVLAQLQDKVTASGVEVVRADQDRARRRMVDELISIRDPDGNEIEIFHTPRRCPDQPFFSARLSSPFVTGAEGLGHAVLATQKISEMRRFYCDVLGFNLSDYIDIQLGPEFTTEAIFLHCNSRHHSIALLAAPFPKRLVHFMLEVENIDDVGRLYSETEKHGVTISGRLGRHTNDRMLSFYMETPSGFELEFGCDGQPIDPENWVPSRYRSTSIWGHERVND